MKRNSFIFYLSYQEALDNLPEKQQLKLYKAICYYALYDKLIRLTKQEKGILNLIIPTLNSSIKRYMANVENGKKGGAPKGNTNAKKQPKTTQNNPETTQNQANKQPKNNLNYNYNYNYNLNYNNKQDKTRQENRIEENNVIVQSSLDKQKYFYEILTDKNNKLMERNLEESPMLNRLQNIFNQMNNEKTITINSQSYNTEDIFKQLTELHSASDEEVLNRITRIFAMVDNKADVKNKYKYTISIFYQQAKELFVNLPK